MKQLQTIFSVRILICSSYISSSPNNFYGIIKGAFPLPNSAQTATNTTKTKSITHSLHHRHKEQVSFTEPTVQGIKMFHVGRFDPSARPKVAATEKKKTTKKRGGEEHNGKSKKLKQNDDDYDDVLSNSSSSVPSSSESDDSSVESSGDNHTSTLKVIAPSQPAAVSHKVNTKKRAEDDEAIDDFDADLDIVEHIATKDDTNLTSTDSAVKRAFQLSRLAIEEAASTWNLPEFLVNNLKADSYENFFPIQCMVIPDVIESERNAHLRGARDICVQAATGSGKTLAFVLPLLTALHKQSPKISSGARGLRRLRALVILPGRDLAKQVYDVFIRYAKGSDLKIGLAVGGGSKRGDLANERRSLVVETYKEAVHEVRTDDGTLLRRKVGGLQELASARLRHSFDPISLDKALDAYDGTLRSDSGPQIFQHFGGRSAVDILVCTPGRLMDHLDTPGFTLQHLKYLVVDEADRLINQPYQNWVGRVLEASNASNLFTSSVAEHASLPAYVKSPHTVAPDKNTFIIDPITHRNFGSAAIEDDDTLVGDFLGQPVHLRKMLFSATLTQDPQKLARLGLVNPKHFDANHFTSSNTNNDNTTSVKTGRYVVPAGLTEKMVECSAEQKPIVLLAILLDQLNSNEGEESEDVDLSIVFTSSVDSTHRLSRLLQLLWEAGGFGKSSQIAEFSSSINAKQRAAILRRCRSPDPSKRVTVLVCSDGMARGMDLPYVGRVINYDVPAYAKTYVHRCGRTARAQRKGVAISVLKGGQVSKFNKMRNLIDGGNIERMGIKKQLVKNVIPTYKTCVHALQRVIEAEENEEMHHYEELRVSEWI